MIPKAGRIMMYTSGWPKNQKRFGKSSGSPPPAGSKNAVPKLRSVSSIVIALAKTRIATNSMNAVTSMAQTNRGSLCIVMPGARMLRIVVTKLIALSSEDMPARCSAKITISTEAPGWPIAESGG